MEDKIILLLLFVILDLIGAKYFLSKKQLLSPAFFMMVLWSFFCIGFLIFDDMKYRYSGIYWIIFAVIIYIFGYEIGVRIRFAGNKKISCVRFYPNILRKIIIVVCTILFLNALYGYILSGGISNVANVAAAYYTSTDSEGTLGVLVNSLMSYGIAMCGGCYYVLEKSRKKFIAFYVFLPPLISMLSTSGKLGVILACILFCIGVIMAAIPLNLKINWRNYFDILKKYWKFVLIVFVMLYFSLLMRIGQYTSYFRKAIGKKFISYAFGSPAAFNVWFNTGDINEYGMGMNTFMSIVSRFTGLVKSRGVYHIFVKTEMWNTNVYTAFRGIIMDFGSVGGIFFMLVVGIIAGLAMNRYKKNSSLISFIVLAMSYLFVFYSFIISPYIYTNLSILMPFVGVSCIICNKLLRKGNSI